MSRVEILWRPPSAFWYHRLGSGLVLHLGPLYVRLYWGLFVW